MSKLVAKCGGIVEPVLGDPTREKGMTAKEFEQYRKNAKRILGYMPIKTPCLTCKTPDSNPERVEAA